MTRIRQPETLKALKQKTPPGRDSPRCAEGVSGIGSEATVTHTVDKDKILGYSRATVQTPANAVDVPRDSKNPSPD